MTEERPPSMGLHDQAAELLEAYSLDALEPDETAVVDAHLDEGCVDCEDDVSALRAVVDRIPLAAPLREAGAALKRRVLTEVEATTAEPVPIGSPRRAPAAARRGRLAALTAPWRPARFASMAASVAVLAVVGLVGWNVVLQDDLSGLDNENEALRATVATVAESQQSTVQALAVAQATAADANARSVGLESRMTAVVAVIGSGEPQRVALSATEDAPDGAWGNILVNPSDGTFLVLATGLDGAVDGGYLLWLRTSDGFVPLAFFSVDQFGNGVGHGQFSGDFSGATLTISHEYDASVPAPTGPAKLERLNR